MLQAQSDMSWQNTVCCVTEKKAASDNNAVPDSDVLEDDNNTDSNSAKCLIDSSVLESLFNSHKAKLYNFVCSRCSNPCDVDDLVQETFLQAMLSVNKFSGKSSFSTWLHGIALNLIRNYYNRSPERKYAVLDNEILQQFESKELTPDMYIEQTDRLNALEIYLQDLPQLSRNMIVVLAVEGVCYEEISERFNVSVSSVKSRLFRTREQLRELTAASM